MFGQEITRVPNYQEIKGVFGQKIARVPNYQDDNGCLSENIDCYFSSNVVIEVELATYDFKYHEEAQQAVDFMQLHCRLFLYNDISTLL